MQIDTEGHCSPSLITFYSSLVVTNFITACACVAQRSAAAAFRGREGTIPGVYPTSRPGLPAETGVYIAAFLRVGGILSFGTGRDGY